MMVFHIYWGKLGFSLWNNREFYVILYKKIQKALETHKFHSRILKKEFHNNQDIKKQQISLLFFC